MLDEHGTERADHVQLEFGPTVAARPDHPPPPGCTDAAS
jgi:hypothetical protein